MKLFLSSENLGKYADEFVSLVNGSKLAYIGNAKDYLSDADRNAKVEEHRIQFESLGIDFTEIDLRDYFDSAKNTEDLLNDFGAVWCSGGNTFLLRSALQQSGLDNVLIKKIKDETLVYGGSSAGAVLAGPTIEGTENGDDPDLVEDVYNNQVNWSGLGLVDFVVVPHFESEWFGVYASKMAKDLEKNGRSFKTLRDGQVILITGNKEIFLS
jgi:dipeptidase E